MLVALAWPDFCKHASSCDPLPTLRSEGITCEQAATCCITGSMIIAAASLFHWLPCQVSHQPCSQQQQLCGLRQGSSF
jgi:hypothetical protein